MNNPGPGASMLDRWKTMAEAENRRARRNWGMSGGTYRRPGRFEDPQVTAARQRRDAQIEAWAAAGMSTRDICARVGMVQTSVNRILRLRRLAARET